MTSPKRLGPSSEAAPLGDASRESTAPRAAPVAGPPPAGRALWGGLLGGLCLAGCALAGGLAGAAREPLLVWGALSAAPLGALAAAACPTATGPVRSLARLGPGGLVFALPALALVLPALALGPARPWAATVLLGLFALGAGVAGWAPRTRAERHGAPGAGPALALLALGALLHGAPVRYGLGRAPWPPAVAARALDLAPSALVMEAAGVDWLRRPALYGPAGADSISPSLRAPWRPALAGAVALMLGFTSLAAARVAQRRRQA
ncbi:MAG: hypothetical protein R3F49_15730 [Planctomycetota bacterium]